MNKTKKITLVDNINYFYEYLLKRKGHFYKLFLGNMKDDNWYSRLCNERYLELGEIEEQFNLLFDDVIKGVDND